MKGIVYMYTSPENKKYIGQTIRSLASRAQQGKGYKGCHAFYAAILKYGWDNFQSKILYEIETDDIENLYKTLNEKEFYYIKYYDTLYPNGYNLSLGGSHNINRLFLDEQEIVRLYTEERKSLKEIAKIFQVSFPTIVNRLEKNNIDHSKRGANSGYWDLYIEENIEDIIFLYTKEKQSLEKIAKLYGYSNKNIIKRHLEYHGVSIRKGKSKKIKQFTLQGEYIKTYDTIKDAIEAVGLKSKSSISNVLAGRAKTAGGFLWEEE